jgi:hypothetical protein
MYVTRSRRPVSLPWPIRCVQAVFGGLLVALLAAAVRMPPAATFILLAVAVAITVPGLPRPVAVGVGMWTALLVDLMALSTPDRPGGAQLLVVTGHMMVLGAFALLVTILHRPRHHIPLIAHVHRRRGP